MLNLEEIFARIGRFIQKSEDSFRNEGYLELNTDNIQVIFGNDSKFKNTNQGLIVDEKYNEENPIALSVLSNYFNSEFIYFRSFEPINDKDFHLHISIVKAINKKDPYSIEDMKKDIEDWVEKLFKSKTIYVYNYFPERNKLEKFKPNNFINNNNNNAKNTKKQLTL